MKRQNNINKQDNINIIPEYSNTNNINTNTNNIVETNTHTNTNTNTTRVKSFIKRETIQNINLKVNSKYFVKNLYRRSQDAFRGIKKNDSGKNMMFNLLEQMTLEGLQGNKESSDEELFSVSYILILNDLFYVF